MSSFLIELNKSRPCRYVFESRLWNVRNKKYGNPVAVLLDTGSFNTIIHKTLLSDFGVTLKQTIHTNVGGFKGDANICIIEKMQIGNLILEKVAALAVPFEGELKDHILLGTNVTNNWKFTVSRLENTLEATEQLSEADLQQQYPYRCCYNNKGQVIAFQELEYN
jgi:hypothetical protein